MPVNAPTSPDPVEASATSATPQVARVPQRMHDAEVKEYFRTAAAADVQRVSSEMRDKINAIMQAWKFSGVGAADKLFKTIQHAKQINATLDPEKIREAIAVVHVAAPQEMQADIRREIFQILDREKTVADQNAQLRIETTTPPTSNTVSDPAVPPPTAPGHENAEESWIKRNYGVWEKFWHRVNERDRKVGGSIRSILLPKSPEGTLNFFSGNFFLWRFANKMLGRSKTKSHH